jgi:hypothetical protein
MSNRPRKPGVFYADKQPEGQPLHILFPVTDAHFGAASPNQFAEDSKAARERAGKARSAAIKARYRAMMAPRSR